jgi:hypothetical protein
MTTPLQQLEFARQQVETVCGSLLSPSPGVLDGCSATLAAALSALAQARSTLRPTADPRLLGEARRLQRALAHARGLLQSAWNYHAGWNRVLNAMTAGYTARGEAAPRSPSGTICLQG